MMPSSAQQPSGSHHQPAGSSEDSPSIALYGSINEVIQHLPLGASRPATVKALEEYREWLEASSNGNWRSAIALAEHQSPGHAATMGLGIALCSGKGAVDIFSFYMDENHHHSFRQSELRISTVQLEPTTLTSAALETLQKHSRNVLGDAFASFKGVVPSIIESRLSKMHGCSGRLQALHEAQELETTLTVDKTWTICNGLGAVVKQLATQRLRMNGSQIKLLRSHFTKDLPDDACGTSVYVLSEKLPGHVLHRFKEATSFGRMGTVSRLWRMQKPTCMSKICNKYCHCHRDQGASSIRLIAARAILEGNAEESTFPSRSDHKRQLVDKSEQALQVWMAFTKAVKEDLEAGISQQEEQARRKSQIIGAVLRIDDSAAIRIDRENPEWQAGTPLEQHSIFDLPERL